MIKEKISSLAIIDSERKVVNNPVFDSNKSFVINISLFHLIENEQYALNISITYDTTEQILNPTIMIGQRKKGSNHEYNLNANLAFKETEQTGTLKSGDYAFQVILGTVDVIDKDNGSAELTTKDMATTYYAITRQEDFE